MRRFLLLLTGILVFNLSVSAQQFNNLEEPIPFDSTIRTGVLPNGLTYYIKHNTEPIGRASFYIYQNVGAMLETDKQDGLAHFLEHMAFNGTNTFPGKNMLNMLERNGVKFGKDVNAYTAQNETVYNISRVPTQNKTLVDSCLLILRDWCNELSLDIDEIDAERGVISEEWRTRQNSASRISAQLAPTIYNGSKYAERDVIGELDVIKNFAPKEIRDFYHDWYRTDLQAVAIVGDIDPAEIEKQVIELFSAIPEVKNPKPRPEFIIPDNQEPMYAVATDRDVKNTTISLQIRHPYQQINTLTGLRETYINNLFNMLIRGRFSEITQGASVPFLSGSVGLGGFVRGYRVFRVNATASKGKEKKAFEAVYSVLQQVINEGFTEGELERLKINLLTGAENSYNNRNQINSDGYCKALKDVYLNGVVLSDAEFTYQFTKEIIPGITLEEVSAVASKYLTDKNRVFTVIAPADQEASILTQDEIQAIISKVQSKKMEAYDDETPVNVDLLSKEPVGGRIIKEKSLDMFDATEWTLSNGVKVVYRFADYQKGSVALVAQSYGGKSLYEPKDLPTLEAVNKFVKTFGIGDYDPVVYKKIMAGKTASSTFNVGSFTESISASSSPKDIETMLQLVYMRFEAPRFDEKKFNNQMKRNYTNLDNQIKAVGDVMKDTLGTILANGNPRVLKFDKDYLDNMSFNRMKEIYEERFSNAADFTFFIVGDIDAETLKPLVEKYIGGIRSNDTKEMWVNRGDYFPKGKNEHQIAVPLDNKATVSLFMKADAKYSRKLVVYHKIMEAILNLRFTENIREKEGGTYGVRVKTSASRIPEMKLSLDINFDCDPAKAEHLKSLVYKELDEIQKNVLQSDLDKVVLNMKKNEEHKDEKNRYWMYALQSWYDTGENITEPAYFDTIINEVTPKDIEKAAQKFFKKTNVVDVIFLPSER